MWRAVHIWRQKFVQFNLWATLYGSWAMGLFPFTYNARTRKLRRSTWQIGYGFILNVGLVWIVYANYATYTDTEVTVELFGRNHLAEQISFMHKYLFLLTLFVTLLRNWWLSKDLRRILNALLRLHAMHFEKLDTSDCFDFDNYVTYKAISIMLELISMLGMDTELWSNFSFGRLLTLLSIILLQLSVMLIGMHFHLAVLCIYRFVWIINRELLRLVYRYPGKSTRVHQLHFLYRRLLELNCQLAAVYDIQMTLFLLTLLSINTICGYYLTVYIMSLRKPLTIAIILNITQGLSINFVDFWLSIAVCDLAERASRGTARILKLFNNNHELDTDLERNLNDFAIFCSHRRLKFKHCGLFHVHNAMGFRMLITSILYLVYLVQFDYMNL